jgi:hypothetical protein
MKFVIFGYPKRVYFIVLIFIILSLFLYFLNLELIIIVCFMISFIYITYSFLPWSSIKIKKKLYEAKINRRGSTLYELKIGNENVARNFWGSQTGYKSFTYDQWKHIRTEPKILSNSALRNFFFYRNMKVEQEEKYFDDFIIRNYKILLAKPQNVFDFVVRFSFNPYFTVKIKNKILKHKNKNHFYLFRNCKSISLVNKNRIKIEVLDSKISKNIKKLYFFETYLRDQPNLLGWGERSWDLHIRFVSKNGKSILIPKNSEFYISTKIIINDGDNLS